MPKQGRRPNLQSRGVPVDDAHQLLLGFPNVRAGRSYGMPSYLLNGRFFARFRDADTVLVLQLATIGERDVLMELDPTAFFYTEHYRNYPAVLVRLDEVAPALLAEVVQEAWRHGSTKPPARARRKPRAREKRRARKR